MNNSAAATLYLDDEIERLYLRHINHGKIAENTSFDDFANNLIEAVDDIVTLIFKILPSIPEMNDTFYESLTHEEFDLVSGLASLISCKPKNLPIILNYNISPDICLNKNGSKSDITTFDPQSQNLLALAENIITYYWENFTVENLHSLKEDEQLALLGIMDTLNVNLAHDEQAHKKLVFGLHIPKEIKLYHRACVDELTLRILTSPVYAGIFESFLDKEECSYLNLPFANTLEDRKFFVSFLMKELSEIWGIPTPIEENFIQKPEKDFEGKEFKTAAHAFLRAAQKDTFSAGLIFGINLHNGYFENQSYNSLNTLAHEFGHLISNFITFGQDYPEITKNDPRVTQSPLTAMQEIRRVFLTNSPFYQYGKYYAHTTTDFSGLPKPEGKHYYKGQLEERHADWVANSVKESVKMALSVRRALRNFDLVKKEIVETGCNIMSDLKLPHKNPVLFSSLENALHSISDFNEIDTITRGFLRTLSQWYRDNVNEPVEMMFMNNNSKSTNCKILTPNLLAKTKMRQMVIALDQFSKCYNLYSDYHGKKSSPVTQTSSLPLEENALSHNA